MNRKLYYFILIVFTSLTSVAQPVVTSGNFPSVGTVVRNYSGSSTREIENKSGANQTWDFSTMSSAFINEVSYVDKNKTNFSSTFPNSKIALDISDGDESDYTYFDITENHVKYLGFAANSSEIPVVAKYDNDWILYSLPLHFNDSFQDNFSVNHTVISNGETIHVYLKANYSYKVDGYGTLITPFGTFPNTLRIYSKTQGRDSSIHSGTTDTTILNSYTSVKVSWISSDMGDVTELASTYDFKNFYFQENNKSTDIKLTSIFINNIIAYPDPASEFISVELPEIKPGQVSINIFDNLGNLIKTDRLNNFSGNNLNWKISVSDIPAGFYFIRINTGTGEWNSKFIKQ